MMGEILIFLIFLVCCYYFIPYLICPGVCFQSLWNVTRWLLGTESLFRDYVVAFSEKARMSSLTKCMMFVSM